MTSERVFRVGERVRTTVDFARHVSHGVIARFDREAGLVTVEWANNPTSTPWPEIHMSWIERDEPVRIPEDERRLLEDEAETAARNERFRRAGVGVAPPQPQALKADPADIVVGSLWRQRSNGAVWRVMQVPEQREPHALVEMASVDTDRHMTATREWLANHAEPYRGWAAHTAPAFKIGDIVRLVEHPETHSAWVGVRARVVGFHARLVDVVTLDTSRTLNPPGRGLAGSPDCFVLDEAPLPAPVPAAHEDATLAAALSTRFPPIRCSRCGGPAYVGLHEVVCERVGGCRTIDERVDAMMEPSRFVVVRHLGDREPYWTAGGFRDSEQHPTREGAIALWREARAAQLRAEDGQ